MTITPTTLYWILMLDNLHNATIALSVIFGIASIFCITIPLINIGINVEVSLNKKILKTALYFILPVFILTLIASAFIPNTKQMATIIVAPKLINSNFVQKDLPKEAKELYGMAKSYLKEQITETKNEVK